MVRPKLDFHTGDVKFWIVAAAGWKASTFRSEAAARKEAVAWARELRDALMPYTCGRYGMLGEDAAKEKWAGKKK